MTADRGDFYGHNKPTVIIFVCTGCNCGVGNKCGNMFAYNTDGALARNVERNNCKARNISGTCSDVGGEFVFAVQKNVAERETDDVELVGGVLVAVEAVISVVERAALTVSGVREVHAEVNKMSGEVPIKIRLAIVLGQNYSAPKVSSEVNLAVNEALRIAFEISNVPVELKVTEITHAIAERERRVV